MNQENINYDLVEVADANKGGSLFWESGVAIVGQFAAMIERLELVEKIGAGILGIVEKFMPVGGDSDTINLPNERIADFAGENEQELGISGLPYTKIAEQVGEIVKQVNRAEDETYIIDKGKSGFGNSAINLGGDRDRNRGSGIEGMVAKVLLTLDNQTEMGVKGLGNIPLSMSYAHVPQLDFSGNGIGAGNETAESKIMNPVDSVIERVSVLEVMGGVAEISSGLGAGQVLPGDSKYAGSLDKSLAYDKGMENIRYNENILSLIHFSEKVSNSDKVADFINPVAETSVGGTYQKNNWADNNLWLDRDRDRGNGLVDDKNNVNEGEQLSVGTQARFDSGWSGNNGKPATGKSGSVVNINKPLIEHLAIQVRDSREGASELKRMVEEVLLGVLDGVGE